VKNKPTNDEIKSWIRAALSFGTGIISHVRDQCELHNYEMPNENDLFWLALECEKEK
jgi:hypothetical protein